MKILVDAGHGIDTPGKRSPDGKFREYLSNREISDLIIARLKSRNIDCDLVVTETNDISLKTRARRVNKVCDELGKDNVILLSIHSNAAGNGDKWYNATGWSCYTTPGETGSDEIATFMYDSFARWFPNRKMRKDLTDGDPDIEENFYIISKTKCPAVLLENFFYDNKEECEWLMHRITQERIANAVVDGIAYYLSCPEI